MNKWTFNYPRPQLKRDSFFSLNGKWYLNGELIEVPFPREAKLSEYQGDLKTTSLIYEKTFSLPAGFAKKTDSIILHFGAVDQICNVYLNDNFVCSHEGGYLDFEVDISKYIQVENKLVVECEDKLNKFYPYGKQTKKSNGMWYTQVSGIWQSVWIEAVPVNYIKAVNIQTSEKGIVMDIDSSANYFGITIVLGNNNKFIKLYKKSHIEISFEEMNEKPRLWDIDDPFLYQVNINTGNDNVDTYFAIRTISIGEENRIYLNNKHLIIKGVLDQGYFNDGLYLPTNPQEYFDEVSRMKELGFNLLRKHIKLEPQVFYYACDKLGMLVMQDMVNSGGFNMLYHAALPTINIKVNFDNLFVNKKRYNFFIEHSKGIIDRVRNHPSVIAYTIYNEGWGQQLADKAYKELKAYDESRLFDSTSGWFRKKLSDIDSEHIYFRNKVISPKNNRPMIISECGGYKAAVKGHMFKTAKSYGYGKADSVKDLTDMYETMFKKMIYPSLENGISGYIITQVSDVESEINGFYTYDREVLKVDKKRMYDLNNHN